MKYTRDTLIRFMQEILEHGPSRGLSTWEEDFVESLSDQLLQRGHLSERQIEILDRIYADRTPT